MANVTVRFCDWPPESSFVDFLRRETPSKFKTTSLSIDVQNMDVQKGRVLVADDFDIPSEVDEFWTKLRTRVVPALKGSKKRSAVAVEARLSEPPELRHQIEEAARAELRRARDCLPRVVPAVRRPPKVPARRGRGR